MSRPRRSLDKRNGTEMQSDEAAVQVMDRHDIHSDLSTLFETAASLIARLLDADLGGVAKVVDSDSVLEMSIIPMADTEQRDAPLVQRITLGDTESMAGRAVSKGSTVMVSDLAADKRFSDEFLQQQGVTSALTVPLRIANKPVAALGVYRARQREFTADNARFAEAIGQLLTSLVARFSAEEMLQERRGNSGREGLLRSAQIALAGGVEENMLSMSDLRSSERHEYTHGQLIGPMIDGAPPMPSDFFEVVCKDISGGGISFYLDNPPDFDSLVVALGPPTSVAHFAARIAHVAQIEQDGTMRYQVGCQFTERVYL